MTVRTDRGELPALSVHMEPGLFGDILSLGLYSSVGQAFFELIKNAWDSIVRFQRTAGATSGYNGLVRWYKFGTADKITLVCLDNGEGITEESMERFCRVGPGEGGARTGWTGQKKIGRLAPFFFLKDRRAGFFVLTATSADETVTLLKITPDLLASGMIPRRTVSRSDTNLYGLRPEDSFTMVVMPDVVEKAMDFEEIARELQWLLPRKSAREGFVLEMDRQEVVAPPLPNELVIQDPASGIAGYFEKVDLKQTDVKSRNTGGIWLCDAETGMRMAYCLSRELVRKVPAPLGRPELRGDIFISELIDHQNTSRDGLKQEFLNSKAWRTIEEKLYRLFSGKLLELLGDEGLFQKDLASQAAKDLVRRMTAIWGPPTIKKPPSGISPDVNDGLLLQDGDEPSDVPPTVDPDKPAAGGSAGGGKRRDKRPRYRPFCYRGKSFFLSISSALRRERVAELSVDGTVVYVNRAHPLWDRFRSAPVALERHLLGGIIGAIEARDPDLQMSAEEHMAVVMAALIEFYEKDSKKQG